MNTRQGIYDTLNNGRQRRSSSLEDLEATLGGIEAKLDRINPRADTNAPYRDDMAERMNRLAAEIGSPRPLPSARTTLQPQNDMTQRNFASQIEAARASEALGGSMASVVEELQQLRTEMRRMTATQSNPSNDWNSAIRKEIETIKVGLGTLAREETLRAADNRWSQIAQRPAVDMAGDPVIEAMLERIEGIQMAIGGLPQSQTLVNVEEKIRVLASAIDQLSRRNPEINATQLIQIEDRLDEISRAIVASSVSVQSTGRDNASFERIETRLLGLNERIDALVNGDHVVDVNNRIAKLSNQLDAIAERPGAPIEQMSRMALQLDTIAVKIQDMDATKADPALIALGLEDRLYEIAARLEQSNAQTGRESREIFTDLEQRLEDLSAQLSRPSQSSDYSEQILNTVEQRFADLSRQMSLPSQAPDYSEQILTAVEQRFADLSRQMSINQAESAIDPNFVANVERRLETITNQLNNSSAPVMATDPAAIQRLERQVQSLAAQLSAPREDFSQFGEINPRLAAIEQSLNANQDLILSAARRAAEDVIASTQVHSRSSDGQAALELANDLKVLEALARKSDERNTKTFEAIHDTLLKIVDRLNSVETTKVMPVQFMEEAPVAAPRTPKINLGNDVPPFDGEVFNDDASFHNIQPTFVRSPVEAALAAANAAKDMAVTLSFDAKPKATAGLLDRLTNSLRRAEPKIQTELAGTNLPTFDMEPLEEAAVSSIQDKPIEPGTKTPDLKAVMKRVRDERKSVAGTDAIGGDTAKTDFLAAARRAAKAAAADVDILRAKAGKGEQKSLSGIAGLLHSQRKPIIMVAFAAILALTGLQLSKALLSNGGEETAAVSDSIIIPAPDTTVITDQETVAKADIEGTSVAAPIIEGQAVRTVDAPALNDTSQAATVDEPVVAAPLEPTAPMTAPVEPEKAEISPTAAPMKAELSGDAEPKSAEPKSAVSKFAEPKSEEPKSAEPKTVVTTSANLPLPEVGSVALREAVAKGDNKALFEVASRFAEGNGTAKDLGKAVVWYQKAADAGFAPAQFRLGSLYEKGATNEQGKILDRSPQKAKELYQLAAEQGNASAMHNLAVLYAMGAAGPADNDSAAQWFIKAAELGVKDSQFNLGILAAKGLGVKQNLEESYKWFALAAKSGDKDASGKRDEIANALRPEQLAKARATTELWRPKTLVQESNAVIVPDSWKADPGQTAAVNPVDVTKAIRNMQGILNQNGYDAGVPDGKIGAKTKKAIAAYQAANGMKATGEPDDALFRSLLKKAKG